MWTDWWMFSTSFNKFIGHFSDRNWCDNESSLVTKDIEKKDGEVETGKESEGGKVSENGQRESNNKLW